MNGVYPRLLLMWLLMVTLVGHSTAEIYRWVDENGKTHFTDRPPQQEKQFKKINIKSQYSTSDLSIPSIEEPSPIRNTRSDAGKSVALEHFSIVLEGVMPGDNIDIGKALMYTSEANKSVSNLYRKDGALNRTLACKPNGSLKLNNAKYIAKEANFSQAAYVALESYGYASAGSEAKKFALQRSNGVDLSLSAEVVSLRIAHCDSGMASSLRQYTQNSTYLKVKWELFDNLARKVVYKAETEGVDDNIQQPPRLNGAPISMERAFQKSVESLLSQQAFVDILLGRTSLSDDAKPSINVMKFKPVYGSKATSFSKKISIIKSATATVRTVSGHGSGFVISQQGHVLTNQHVVAGNNDALVLIDGNEYRAQVVFTDNRRDVAVLKIDNGYDRKPIEIHPDLAELGEPIYVIGTPLDENLEFSISRGIISSKRDIDGLPYYQTDAAVNPGNSGGPVFNDYGNVIGMTVSGLFTHDGGSRNINYIIPIDDALKIIGL